jgi:hypothetical protein
MYWMNHRPDVWNCSKDEWQKYLDSNEGNADQKQWIFMEQQRNEIDRKDYYLNRANADTDRKKGDRIYYEPGKGYYLVNFKKRNFWGF